MLKEDRLIRDNIKDFRLLLEYVDRNVIIDAINNRYIIKIYYAGDETVNRGFRTIEPYIMGIHKDTQSIVLRAWQQAGASDTPNGQGNRNEPIRGGAGAWRMFRLDGITSVYPYPNSHFAEKKGNVRPEYNDDGTDGHMSTVLAAVVTSGDGIAVDLKGQGNLDDPNSIGVKLGGGDKELEALKKFYQDSQKLAKYYNDPKNKEQILQRRVSDFYYMLKQNGKDPAKYVVTEKDGVLWYQNINTKGYSKLSDDQIVGNLNKLFRQQNDPNQFKIDKSFEKKQRTDMEDLIRKGSGY